MKCQAVGRYTGGQQRAVQWPADQSSAMASGEQCNGQQQMRAVPVQQEEQGLITASGLLLQWTIPPSGHSPSHSWTEPKQSSRIISAPPYPRLSNRSSQCHVGMINTQSSNTLRKGAFLITKTGQILASSWTKDLAGLCFVMK